METDVREAMCCGVFVEFCDEQGRCVAQSAYLDWDQRMIPAVGDVFSSTAANSRTGRTTTFRGRIRSRQFDVQRDASGTASLLVRLEVELAPRAAGSGKAALPRYAPVMFSDN